MASRIWDKHNMEQLERTGAHYMEEVEALKPHNAFMDIVHQLDCSDQTNTEHWDDNWTSE